MLFLESLPLLPVANELIWLAACSDNIDIKQMNYRYVYFDKFHDHLHVIL